ncbi:MAG: class II aldolase/adducin family protein, partial [Oscillospiraceae bacterium]|nr:class II aldolase/adducin family protein [Oscillospiraceae bacterium]
SGKVKGAALDVFPLEPPASDDPLVLLPNVLSTPHIAGNTRQVGIHQGLIMAENIKKLLAGELSTDVINRKAFQSFSFTGEKKFDTAALKQLEGKVVGVNDLDTGKSAAASVPEAKASIPAPVPAAASAPAGGGYMALIQGFLNNMAADTDVKAKTANKDISFQITFKDTEESCYMIFKKGDITVGLGECPDGAEVNLRMPVDCFDGMMMGTKKVMDIVSSGALSFTGNIRKAMTMQPMLKMMMGSYQAAVAKTGFRLEDAGSPAAVSAPSGIGYLGLINEFLGIMAADTDVKAKTANKDISFQITFKDTEESCYMIFKKGDITVGLGECPDGAEVNLRMPIDCFDGMMMGTMKVMDIVSSGALSFTGNIRKAMSMQPMLKMMMGSYQAAVAKTGFRMADLGAVGAADKAAPAAPAQAPAQPQAQAAPAAVPQQEAPAKPGFFGKRKLFGGKQQAQPVVQQVIMEAGKPKTGDVRDEILQITTEMYAKGLITGIGGNISARCDDNPDHIWITPSSIFKGDLRADQMVRLDMNGKAVGGAELSASSEKNVHLAIYQRRPEISAVIHSHATKSTLMGLAGLKFAPISSDAAFFGDVPVVPFIIPGSPELGDLVGEAVGEEGAAVIMQNHGLVVAGTNLRRASDMTDCIETTATKILEAKAMGIELSQIPPADVEELAALGKMLV